MTDSVPVITIDGPSASGKGTVTAEVADALGWHVLDSGALYRLTALSCLQYNIDLNNPELIAKEAAALDISFQGGQTYLRGQEVSDKLRTEETGAAASQLAAMPVVREALLAKQYEFRCSPGLVADGRDMGTVVFPDAPLKIFLVADVHERAQRRYKQLKEKGISVKLQDLTEELQARDARDTQRASSPLKPSSDAVIIDSTHMQISEVSDLILKHWRERSCGAA